MSDERVIPGITGIGNLTRHVARYNMALSCSMGSRVLDAACGTGYGTAILSMAAKHVVGWDKDVDTIEYAQNNYGKDNNEFHVVDLEKPINDELVNGVKPFDVVVSLETLEHLKRPDKTVGMLAEHLKEGGIFVASVPLNESKGENEHHKHVFTLSTARELFAGFSKMDEAVQSGLSFYPPDLANEYPMERVYYVFIGFKQ